MFAEETENLHLISNNIVYIHVYSEKYIPTCRCELTNQMSHLLEVNNKLSLLCWWIFDYGGQLNNEIHKNLFSTTNYNASYDICALIFFPVKSQTCTIWTPFWVTTMRSSRPSPTMSSLSTPITGQEKLLCHSRL